MEEERSILRELLLSDVGFLGCPQEGAEFAQSHSLLFMETSARLDHRVTEVFTALARELLQRAERKERQAQRGDARLALNQGPRGPARCCTR